MKKVLIISPYFPPANAADMQRVRMSLPYFKELGWEAEVVTCFPKYYGSNIDSLLLECVPKDVKIHYVKALSKRLTSKIGLGSLALRSLWFFKQKVNTLLRQNNYDLIYFSTTQFPLCILGPYWKNKFKIPYVIDMQDPWHSDYYEDKPKEERPPKYWFSYRLNKYLENIAMKKVDGLIAVSAQYHHDLKTRYNLDVPCATITFGAFDEDITIAQRNISKYPPLRTSTNKIEIGYIGRGGYDMQDSIRVLFSAFKDALTANHSYFSQFHFNFMGTSYASQGKGVKTIEPIGRALNLDKYVTENTDRIPFYQTLNTLAEMDILFICGSNDPKYTASKIFPYLMLEKPLISIFHEESSTVGIIRNCSNATVITFQEDHQIQQEKILNFFQNYTKTNFQLNKKTFLPFTAKEMTVKQTTLFNNVLNFSHAK